jgi:uncharacterized membrane protein
MNTLIEVLSITTAVGAALMAGTFFTFSTFVMPALNRLEAPRAIEAMQHINITVMNPLTMGVFFGTAIASLTLIVVACITPLSATDRTMLLTASLLYVLGTFVLTAAGNVPLNDRLAKQDPHDSNASSVWAQYERPWTRFNHMRTVAPLASVVLILLIP